MAKEMNHRKDKKTGVPFYVAVKSNNEVYYQMASLFQEVTRGRSGRSTKLMEQILKSRGVIIPGNNLVDNI